MGPVKTVGVKELKNRLSEYLREVRRGTRVLVTDRSEVVAEFKQPGSDPLADGRHPRAAEWIDSGVLTPPTRAKAPLPRSPVTLPAGTARAIIDALRDENPTVTGAVYLESSALLSWLLGEPDGEVARRILDAASAVLTSRLTLVEAARGLLRAEHERRISAADRHTLTGMLAAAAASWFRLSMADSTCERAEKPFPVEPVRTLDALHLASALTALEVYPGLAVLTFDDRVMTNARGLGLFVLPPPVVPDRTT